MLQGLIYQRFSSVYQALFLFIAKRRCIRFDKKNSNLLVVTEKAPYWADARDTELFILARLDSSLLTVAGRCDARFLDRYHKSPFDYWDRQS